MRIDSSPRRLARATSIWTFVTSGRVASKTSKMAFARCAPHGKPMSGENQNGAIRHFANLLYKKVARAGAEAVHYIAVMHDFIAERKWRAVNSERISTMLIARSTPAQKEKPRGLVNRICIPAPIDFQHFNIKVNGRPASGWLKSTVTSRR